MPLPQIAIAVGEASQVGEARRMAAAMAAQMEMEEADRGRVGIVATELATNLVRHAQAGEMLLRPLFGPPHGVEFLSLDAGPGMANLSQCLADGYSSAGTSGNGLGAVQRLSDEFGLASTPAQGTVLFARVFAAATGSLRGAAGGGDHPGVVSLPVHGETLCGDAWAAAHCGPLSAFLVADGLGHGALAAAAAATATAVFRADPFRPPAELLAAAHAALQGSRGAAAVFVQLDRSHGCCRYAGVGNIAGSILSLDSRRHGLSHNGIVGFGKIRIEEASLPWTPQSRLILHSDGISARWNGSGDRTFYSLPPAVAAGLLYRDFKRPHDDATVLVAQ